MPLSIRDANRADLAPITALLRDADLVLDGVEDHVGSFLVAEHDGVLAGVMGLEMYTPAALLRSAVVALAQRGTGIGRELFDALRSRARANGIDTLYLLTTTAGPYWSRRGFIQITRDDVPMDVRGSAEFTGACPASATVMSLKVGGGTGLNVGLQGPIA